MILLRHKEQKLYSSPMMKFVAGAKKAMNTATTKIDNVGLGVGNTIKNAVQGGGRSLNNPSFRFSPKTATQLGRETIGLKNQAVKAVNTPIGGVVDKGVQAAIKDLM